MSAHTPGPWIVGETRYAGKHQLVNAPSRTRGFVCEVQAPVIGDEFDTVTREANARLIAKAPDMLALLAEYAEPNERKTFTEHAEWENDWARRVNELLAALT